jgi:crotonobetainyl-CoA:carnitine CoA-transferase CaiB-like acyl-CoA transferase
VKVIEAATFIAGPFAAMMLADLGASVTKVESIPDGDPMRRMGASEQGESLLWLNCNRDKDIAFLDLKGADDQAELQRLLADTDVLITNWRTTSAESFGMTDDVVRRRHPRLVWAKLSGYGQSGPLVDQPAFDPVIQARSGIGFVQGTHDEPELLRFFYADKTAAAFVVSAALAALLRRERTGQGAIVDVPMLDSLVYFNFPDVYTSLTRLDGDQRGFLPRPRGSQLVPTADGWLLVGPVGGRQIAATLDAIGRSDDADELFAAGPGLSPMLYDLLRQELPKRTTAEWLDEFVRRQVPAGPVLDPGQTIDDPQVVHNEVFGETVHPILGRLRTARFPAKDMA